MRIFSSIAAMAAVALVRAGAVLEERGTFEQPGVISVGNYYDTPSTAEPMETYGSQTPAPLVANVAPTVASSAASPSKTQYVTVGGTGGLVYTPEYIFAEVGEVVIFHFGTKNHTFTQSTFPEPCAAMPNGIRFHLPC